MSGAEAVEPGVDEARSATRGLPALELEQLERIAIQLALAEAWWHQGRAAETLGVSPRTLHRKIRTLGLERP